jgi:2-amino-4-hydroxy-6-hydroxymethyldihydropteridine diphosphokinase
MIYNYFLGLGTNIEPRLEYLRTALKKLALFGRIKQRSSIYRTQAWGEKKQGDYYNAVIEFESVYSPPDLLAILKQIEAETGRTSSYRWGPRQIDIDIVYCRQMTVSEPELTIPHRFISERRFILEPLAELEATLPIDGNGTTVQEAQRLCRDSSYIHKLDLVW